MFWKKCFYRPQTKLREGNVFYTCLSVDLFTGGVHGRGACMGGVHGRGIHGRGTGMAGMAGRHVWWSGMCVQEIATEAGGILLECILGIVLNTFSRLTR